MCQRGNTGPRGLSEKESILVIHESDGTLRLKGHLAIFVSIGLSQKIPLVLKKTNDTIEQKFRKCLIKDSFENFTIVTFSNFVQMYFFSFIFFNSVPNHSIPCSVLTIRKNLEL